MRSLDPEPGDIVYVSRIRRPPRRFKVASVMRCFPIFDTGSLVYGHYMDDRDERLACVPLRRVTQ